MKVGFNLFSACKRQQIKWFGHVIKQRELNITQRVINKKCENTRPTGRPRKRWIDGIYEALGNITAEELKTTVCLSPQR
jgi:hypothetical protein